MIRNKYNERRGGFIYAENHSYPGYAGHDENFRDMVVMSMAAYERQLARAEMYTQIMEGKAQADRNELLDGPASLTKLRDKYAK